MTVTRAQFDALFDPKGVVVAGASTHPGKFGFVALHNILACGYEGNVFATNRDGGELLGIDTLTDIDQVPDGAADLVFLCTPGGGQRRHPAGLRGQGHHRRLLLVGRLRRGGGGGARRPSTTWSPSATSSASCSSGPTARASSRRPSSLCAQIVAPYPPAGRIGVASQSGNFISSFQNFAQHYGVGVSRAVSAGNAAMVGRRRLPRVLRRRPRDRRRPRLRRGHPRRARLLRAGAGGRRAHAGRAS